MKTLRLLRGDLVILGSDYQEVSGEFKIQQDIRNALLEPLGNDRFHPGWGSVLDRFTGLPLTVDLRSRVGQEITRVVMNHAAVQRDMLQRDALNGKASRFTTADVIKSVDGISVTQDGDTLSANISLTTLGAYNIAISVPVAGGTR